MKSVTLLFALLLSVNGKIHYEDLAAQQTVRYSERVKRPNILTTGNGKPVDFLDANVSINRKFLFNEMLVESLTHMNRQRIPERPVHAKGAGAFGYFEVTHDISNISKAKFLNEVGKRTPIAVRFSTIASNLGGIDTIRDVRGIAVKFYTEEGNLDLLTLNTPIFAIKDPLFFPSLSSAQGRNPATGLQDANMLWDFITLRPESIFYFLLSFSDLGITDGYRYMSTYGIHTYQVVNATGHSSFVRFKFKSDHDIKYLTSDEGAAIGGKDPDYAVRDLYNAIENGDFPCWTLKMQTLTLEEVKQADFDVFDTTKFLPEEKYPMKPVGRFCLDKNPINHFVQVEQLAMCPANLVPGFLGAPDKLFEARILSYRDAQYHRLGANFQNIPVNCPFKSATYNSEGLFNTTQTDAPIYYPNSYNGPMPSVDEYRSEVIDIKQDFSLNFDQAGRFYENLSGESKQRLVDNVAESLGGVDSKVQERALEWFEIIHPGFCQAMKESLLKEKSKNRAENSYPDRYVSLIF